MSQDRQQAAKGGQPKRQTQPAKPNDPLTEDVEQALIDQDIPVETGVRPDGAQRR